MGEEKKMKVRILIEKNNNEMMEEVLDVIEIKERDLGLQGVKLILTFINNRTLEIDLKDVFYINQLVIIKKKNARENTIS